MNGQTATQTETAAKTKAELLIEIEMLKEQIKEFHFHNAALEWKRMQERFHGFDAIKNDACPACGGRVAVVEDHNSVRLEAVSGVVDLPSSGPKVWS